jgi:hypothetical protein
MTTTVYERMRVNPPPLPDRIGFGHVQFPGRTLGGILELFAEILKHESQNPRTDEFTAVVARSSECHGVIKGFVLLVIAERHTKLLRDPLNAFVHGNGISEFRVNIHPNVFDPLPTLSKLLQSNSAFFGVRTAARLKTSSRWRLRGDCLESASNVTRL